jgi:diphthine methyl ester synthase
MVPIESGNENRSLFGSNVVGAISMFYLIGLGLCDEKDITVKGLEVSLSRNSGLHLRIKAVRGCSRVYLEAYTSILMIEQTKLVINPRSMTPVCTELCQEEFYGKTLIVADRDTVESDSDTILDGAGETDVALLVVGDPFGYA